MKSELETVKGGNTQGGPPAQVLFGKMMNALLRAKAILESIGKDGEQPVQIGVKR